MKKLLISTLLILSTCTVDGMTKIIKKISICYPCLGFEKTINAIAESKNFYANLDPRDQRTPGRLFLQTKQHITSLTDWNDELWIEFGKLSKTLQQALHQGLDSQEKNKLINVTCLMNLAREEGTHTHWHFIPRYRNPITLKDPETEQELLFEDTMYGKPYDFDPINYRTISLPLQIIIIKKIQQQLDLSNLPNAKLKQFSCL